MDVRIVHANIRFAIALRTAGEYTRLPDSADTDAAVSSYSARHKACLITNVYKLLLTPAVAILIVYLRCQTGYSLGSFPIEDLKLVTWHAITSPANAAVVDWFALNVVSSFAGYVFGVLACMMCMQVAAFAIPLTLATPVALVACYLISDCEDGLQNLASCPLPTVHIVELGWVIGTTGCLWIAQILSTLVDIFRSQPIVMEKESNVRGMASRAFAGRGVLKHRLPASVLLPLFY